MNLSKHFERQRTPTHQNGSRKRITMESNNNNNNNSHQPIWVKLEIVKQKHGGFNDHNDDDNISINTTGSTNSSARRLLQSRSSSNNNNKIAGITNRASNGWGWLFGYDLSTSSYSNENDDENDDDTRFQQKKNTKNGRYCEQSQENEPAASIDDKSNVKTSPFGQIKLRKTPNSTVRKDIMQSSSSSSPKLNRNHKVIPKNQTLQRSKIIQIEDEWNKSFNGIKINLTAEEVSKNVVLANIFPIELNNDQNDNDGHHHHHHHRRRRRQEPPKNLIELTHLHEPSLIKSLKERYDSGKVYTFCGKILIALNPFCEMKDLYSKSTMMRYWSQVDANSSDNESSNIEPHVYAIAHEAFSSMIRAFDDCSNNDNEIQIDQSILVSGESGAGKTVTTKIVMQYLATLSEKSAATSENKISTSSSTSSSSSSSQRGSRSMEQQVLQSNPVLESFGNARTIRNDNSSRFGKFIEIQFHKSGCLMGASINTYLLEKVRLIRQADGERNYHIFYELLKGLGVREKRQLGLQGLGVHDFRITACSDTIDRRDNVKDEDTYKALRHAMRTVGFSADEQVEILQVTCGLLHMSNINFLETKSDIVILDESNPSLKYVKELFGVTLKSLNDSLCTCTITVANEVVKKNLSLEKVEKAMEALMKATYGALFDYIVRRVNSSIEVGGETGGEYDQTQLHLTQDVAFIKILDIFGFESFETNSFEQLCINYCNEALQQQFNKFIFKLEQQEYERENIAWSFISFPDNQDVLDLIEKKHVGIFSILDEQCKLAKCTDSSFSLAMYEKCSDHPRFGSNRTQKARGLFAVQHYAGNVEYDTTSFLDKNKDELPKEATDFLLSSSIATVSKLGLILYDKSGNGGGFGVSQRKAVKKKGSSLSRASVGNQFTVQLKELRLKIDMTVPHYIRCIKPNDDLTPNNFVPAVIADQLCCAGVLEAVRVSRVGYPQRYTKDLFVKRYWMLSVKTIEKTKMARRRDLCEELVESIVPLIWTVQQDGDNASKLIQRATYDLVSVGIQLGKTKVFLRHQAFNALEYLRNRTLRNAASRIQSVVHMFCNRKRYIKMLYSALAIQCCIRSYKAKRVLQSLKESKKVVIIQSAWRSYSAYAKYSDVLFLSSWCQRVYRGNVARAKTRTLLTHKKATKIQNWWRMANERKSYLILQYIAFNLQQGFRSWKARKIVRQLKIEAKNISRVTEERDRLNVKLEDMKLKIAESNRLAEERIKQMKIEAMLEVEKEVKRQVKIAAKQVGEDRRCESSIRPNESCSGDEVRNLRAECTRKDREIKELKQSFRSNDSCSGDEIRNLRAKCTRKESENKELRQQIEQLKTVINTFHANLKNSGMSRTSALTGSIKSVSLLDLERDSKTPNTERSTIPPDIYESSSDLTPLRLGSLNFDTAIHTAIRAADDDALSVALSTCDDIASDINRGDRDGKSPLHLAVLNSNLGSAKFLLYNQSVANTQDRDGNTPLHYAESSSMVKILLEMGKANPNIPNESGVCAVHVAVRRRDTESVRLLIKHHANINVADDVKWKTPLHLISHPFNFQQGLQAGEEILSATTEIARILLNVKEPCPADVDYQDKDGNTPLHHAVVLSSRNTGDLISLFLKRKANPNIQNNRGQTPMHLLLHNINLRKYDFYDDLIQLFLYHGLKPNIPSMSGCVALHLALYHHDTKSAVLLVENGAQLHLPWAKPPRWNAHWTEFESGDVYCLEMVDDEEIRHNLVSSVSCKQNEAPIKTHCMQCKRKIGTFVRSKNCRHCGSFVCSSCAPNKLDNSFFPSFCEIMEGEDAQVCLICESLLISRRREANIMGREVYAIHCKQEDVSFLDMEVSQQSEDIVSQLQVEM